MIERQDDLSHRHPLPGETLLRYIERVIMGHSRWPLTSAETACGTGPLFEPSYVFAPYVPTDVIENILK